MAKFHIFLFLFLFLSLVATSNIGGVSAAAEDNSDLQQRRATMAEAVRVFSNPVLAAAADSETVQRLGLFMKHEIGPLGPVFDAISKMPENSAADARSKEEASDAALELLMRHFRQLMPQGHAKTDEL